MSRLRKLDEVKVGDVPAAAGSPAMPREAWKIGVGHPNRPTCACTRRSYMESSRRDLRCFDNQETD
jgi:hypothetical protein